MKPKKKALIRANEEGSEKAQLLREFYDIPITPGVTIQGVKAYHEYLDSWNWKRKSLLVKRYHNLTCQKCNKGPMLPKYLQCHHTTYIRVGSEKFEDLQSLCGKCHKKIHEGKGSPGT